MLGERAKATIFLTVGTEAEAARPILLADPKHTHQTHAHTFFQSREALR
jgi:hypothetical protein